MNTYHKPSTAFRYCLINIVDICNMICYLGQLGSVRARDLFPCQTLLKISRPYPSFLPHMVIFMLRNESERKCVRDTLTQTDTRTGSQDILQASKDSESFNKQDGKKTQEE